MFAAAGFPCGGFSFVFLSAALVETASALQRLTERQAASGAILFLLFPKISGYALRFSGALCNALHY